MKKVTTKAAKKVTVTPKAKEGEFGMLARLVVDGFDRIEKRFTGVDEQFKGIDARLDGIDNRLEGMDKRFDGIDSRLNGIDSSLSSIIRRVDLTEKKTAK